MGGPGSGRWQRWGTRQTVEDSLVLAVRDFRGRLFPSAIGTFTWARRGGNGYSINYRLDRFGGSLTVTLSYQWRGEDVLTEIHFQTTPTNFPGLRFWFECPLAVRGAACCRRSFKLYLPPGARHFGCRRCYGLTYRSAQEAHRVGRMAVSLGFDPKVIERLVKSGGDG